MSPILILAENLTADGRHTRFQLADKHLVERVQMERVVLRRLILRHNCQ